ncbi:septum formation initiator family protein [Alkalibacterium putridalgicola]|jgi:cell division protein DivIC|uniref:Cell division protein DivIC n=1 Tax=Alkalibacterium putridalgicola TaxID=426703 RepID=A0A1H7W551_9LACT|nr:septum formation initiator family protein [Alkalibacterium putridalgicola]GEK90000.1 cell division protein DIVIC [Alkalibacterium putridalgicola]SEM16128.1 cell division protein DivIC [Alkalibacterium putridalgicola]
MDKKKQSVTRMENPYIQHKTLESIREFKYKRKLKRRMQLIVAAGIMLILLVGSGLVRNYYTLQKLEDQKVQAQEELESLDLRQEELEYYIGLLEDEEYVAKLARSEYYLTKDNEIVFSFPDDRNPDHTEVTEEEAAGFEEEETGNEE